MKKIPLELEQLHAALGSNLEQLREYMIKNANSIPSYDVIFIYNSYRLEDVLDKFVEAYAK